MNLYNKFKEFPEVVEIWEKRKGNFIEIFILLNISIYDCDLMFKLFENENELLKKYKNYCWNIHYLPHTIDKIHYLNKFIQAY